MNTQVRIRDLLQQYVKNELSAVERSELMQLLGAGGYDEELILQLLDTLAVGQEADIHYSPGKYAGVINKILSRDQLKLIISAHRIRFLKTTWLRYAAAILLIIGIAAYLLNSRSTNVLVQHTAPASVKNDILPGSDRAVLTLSNGKQITLDGAASETITDGDLSIENNKGQLVYKKGKMVATNTMSTPKGGQYTLTLSDGTNVWLNAASSITYPTAFNGKQRIVTITGEAYFEVAENKQQPFIVMSEEQQITVLGTSFNVNVYPDEISKTSLVNGSIKINKAIIRPGEAFTNGKIIRTDIEQDIAWKNGAFRFNRTDITVVLRQLSRWYDVDIIYPDGPFTKNISGSMGRDLTLSEALDVLKGLGVHGKIEGKKLFIFQ